MIVNNKATVYAEIQQPDPSWFNEVDQHNEEEEEEEEEDQDHQGDGSFSMNLDDNDIVLEETHRTETPDNFHVQNTPRYDSPKYDSPRRVDASFQSSTQLQGHENASLFNTQSTINSNGESANPSIPPGEKYDFLFENKKKWHRIIEFPLVFKNFVSDGEVIIDKMSFPKKTPHLLFVPREDLDIDGDDGIPLKKNKTKNERQLQAAKEKKSTKKKHARKNEKRDDTFQMDDNFEYILTDLPKNRELLIYQEKFLSGPLKFLLDHHKTLGNLPDDPEELDDYIKKRIWPELKRTYRYGEIMQRRKDSNDGPWKSSCKPNNLSFILFIVSNNSLLT